MLTCYLCEKSAPFGANFCGDCQRIKEIVSVYGGEVHDVVEKVFVRTPQQQVNKISIELKKQIENKKVELNSVK